ncbi:E3 ubiquitin-protein ligase RNF14 isoform X2 [Chiloscyllium punctatum]|uniref:E3 ubiquitin-protein ligase RNF14 isoform X2 n=1 Tax=Chiloscyllium punctatum TaxID=137246 RepID=UPI003B635418
MSARDREEQEDELLALASIYEEDEFKRAESTPGGEISICLELPPNFKIHVQGDEKQNKKDLTEYAVSFLPSLVLKFVLPPDYPSFSAPKYTLSCRWLFRTQVKDLVSEEIFARYDRLLLQSTLDLMTDVVYCPRTVCKSVVMLEPGNTMGVCPGCRYAFCALCEMAYHGISPCRLKAEKLSALRDEYLNADESEKLRLEKSYGRRVLQRAVEELCSQEWLDKNSKPCPRCGTNIQKVDGCNKMTCTGCKQHFCWLCICPLSKVNPYSHFSDSSSPCFNELFQGIDFEAQDDILRDEDDDGIV